MYFKPKISFGLILTIIVFLIGNACHKDEESIEEYPSLRVVNQLEDSWRSIVSVSLVGYEFDNLNIEFDGDEQTFVLNEGMPGGYDDINVTVRYVRYPNIPVEPASIKVDFVRGETTTITLTGCISVEGCSGIYLE